MKTDGILIALGVAGLFYVLTRQKSNQSLPPTQHPQTTALVSVVEASNLVALPAIGSGATNDQRAAAGLLTAAGGRPDAFTISVLYDQYISRDPMPAMTQRAFEVSHGWT